MSKKDHDEEFHLAQDSQLLSNWDPAAGSDQKEGSVQSAAKKDNRLLAIITCQLYALTMVFIGVTYKIGSMEYGVTIGDFQYCRAFLMFITITPYMRCIPRQPCKHLRVKSIDERPPSKLLSVLTMCARSFFGVSDFVLYIWGVSLVPLALATILFNLAPFWTSILAYLINGEKIYPLEYLAMGLCFGMVICLTLFSGE
jgi:drug/metabolite transporter (DMT)-like permease